MARDNSQKRGKAFLSSPHNPLNCFVDIFSLALLQFARFQNVENNLLQRVLLSLQELRQILPSVLAFFRLPQRPTLESTI